MYITGAHQDLTNQQVLFLPEASDYIARSPLESLTLAQPESQSPFVLGLQSAARQHSLAVHVGIHVPVPMPVPVPVSVAAPVPPSPPSDSARAPPPAGAKLLNRTIWIDADGTLNPAGTYDKVHLFDYGQLRESAHTQAGARLTPPLDTAVGRLGPLVCFDLRFPEPSLALGQPGAASAWARRPAQLLAYPSAFTVPTGAAHWEVLLRARAVESQCFVVAAAQVGHHHGAGGARVSYGRSMVIDPWGRVLCALGGVAEDGTVDDGAVGQLGLVEVDLGEWERVRQRMPLVRRTWVSLSLSLFLPLSRTGVKKQFGFFCFVFKKIKGWADISSMNWLQGRLPGDLTCHVTFNRDGGVSLLRLSRDRRDPAAGAPGRLMQGSKSKVVVVVAPGLRTFSSFPEQHPREATVEPR